MFKNYLIFVLLRLTSHWSQGYNTFWSNFWWDPLCQILNLRLSPRWFIENVSLSFSQYKFSFFSICKLWTSLQMVFFEYPNLTDLSEFSSWHISSVKPSWIFLLIFIWSTWQIQPQLLSLNWVNFGSKLSNETEVWGLQETDAMLVNFSTIPFFILYLEQYYSTFWYYPYRFLVLCWWNYFFPYAQVDLNLCFLGAWGHRVLCTSSLFSHREGWCSHCFTSSETKMTGHALQTTLSTLEEGSWVGPPFSKSDHKTARITHVL